MLWLARRAVCSLLAGLSRGELTILEGKERRRFGKLCSEFPLRATIVVHDPRFWAHVAFGGSIGAGESYARGAWSADDLTALTRIIAANPDLGYDMDEGFARVRMALGRLWHRLRRNSRRGSRANISAHYDLGNEFFSLFLDDTMMYSCAVFPRESSSLEEASRNKLDEICRRLELAPGDRVVEIGTGWGGFALHAARAYGCSVVTTTVSEKQHAFVSRRVREAGLEDRIQVLREDYRALPARTSGRFDKLVSIEMIEAVGHEFLGDYFRACRDLLVPGGKMFLQAIVVRDEAYEHYRRSVDFIQRYIFPGGCLPSLARIRDLATKTADLRVEQVRDITPHYARTLAQWRQRLLANARRVKDLGFPESFVRTWEYYFCYCEGGFLERSIGDVQVVLSRPTTPSS